MEFRKGAKVPFSEKIKEGYEYDEPYFAANVSAGKIRAVLEHFISIHNEYLFFILELPSNQKDEEEMLEGQVNAFHKDIYYIDGCTQSAAKDLLKQIADLMINDGLCSFGFGCHQTHDEIMVGKYNVVTVFTKMPQQYDGFFEEHGINRVEELITAWNTFSNDSPGESSRIDTDGKSVFDIPDLLKEKGIYFAERRED